MGGEPNDVVSEGWPDEPGNADLEAFARRVRQAIPAAPAGAIDRAGSAMRRRIEQQNRRGWRRLGLMAAAAAVLLGLATYAWLLPQASRPASVTAVRDEYRVSLAAGRVGEVPGRALVPVREYEGLLGR